MRVDPPLPQMDPLSRTEDRQTAQNAWRRGFGERSPVQRDVARREGVLVYGARTDSLERAMPSQIHFAPRYAAPNYVGEAEKLEQQLRRSPGYGPRPERYGSPNEADRWDQQPRRSPGYGPRPDFRPPSERRPSNASSYVSSPGFYPPAPPPTRPLPPLPPKSPSRRLPSRESFKSSSLDSIRSSRSSARTSGPDWTSLRSPIDKGPPSSPISRVSERTQEEASKIDISFMKSFEADKKKKKDNTIFYMDVSSNSTTLACKHGKSSIKVWSILDATNHSTLKFAAYTEAQCRSREYMIRSHAILSEPSNLIAIATRFGTVLEIWNWADRKCLQSIDKADRWVACHTKSIDTGGGAVAVYHGETSCIDLYTLTQAKAPLAALRTIDLRAADLPFVLQYPELALSPTSPMLVAAAGPRPPKPGHPPPDRETLLVAWDIGNADASSQPYMVARPWQYKEIDTAVPCDLATYGSVVVSIWIPAGFQVVTVPAKNGGETFNLRPIAVPYKHVLVWDLASNSTRTFRIPNTVACVSPDCRFVAYCHASTTNMGGRGSLVVLDVITGKEVWCWPDRDATAFESGPKEGFEQLNALNKVTEMTFSIDGRHLFIGDRDGQCCMYKVLG